MPAVRHCGRIDTFELKLQMERRIGSQKSERYFNLLTRYLSLKLGKSEFDKLCICLIGRENIRLHNELIRSILKNATVSNMPPPKAVKHDSLLNLKDSNGSLQSICRDVFPQSPRKGRTPNLRERKFKDRPSPLGLNEKNHRRIPITAPFGINVNDARKVSRKDSCSSSRTETCQYNGQLQSTNSLENRLKQKCKTEGLDISMDCVNQLRNGLDSYLKRLIKASMELASSRSLHQPDKRVTVSLLDFQTAVTCSPKILGEDWPVQLEKICFEDE